MTDDSLLYLLRAPAFVERTLRATLAEMLSLRRVYGGEPDVRTFIKLALLWSRRPGDVDAEHADALTRHELEAAVVRAAAFFAVSPLGRRLRTIPLVRIGEAPEGTDVAVFDRNRKQHYVRLETYAGIDARLEAVTRAVRAMDAAPLGRRGSLHFFSLRDGTLRSYPAATAGRRIAESRAAMKAA